MRKIAVDWDETCKRLAKKFGISKAEIAMTVNDDERYVAVATDDFSRLIVFREFPAGRIIMAECLVTEKEEREVKSKGQPAKEIILKRVTVKLAIELRRNLPAGSLSRNKQDGELNLAMVAESFGFPVSGHSEEPLSTLYSGAWDGKPIRIVRGADAPYLCCAHIDRDAMECDLVWAIDLDRYTLWRNKHRK